MRRRACVPLLAVLLVAVLGSGALGERKPADRVWTRTGLENCNLRRIAILPPVGEPREGALSLEDRWFLRVFRDGRGWLSSAMVVDHLARNPRQGEVLLARIREQISRNGEVDSASATQIARAIGADAVLSLRLDRWERLGGGSKTTARVEATCALRDSSGHLLWKVTGAESVDGLFGIPTGKVGNALQPSHDDRLAGSMLVLASFTPGGHAAVLAGAQGTTPSQPNSAPGPGTTTPIPSTPTPPPPPPSPPPYYNPNYRDDREERLLKEARSGLNSRPLSGGTMPFEGRLAPDFDLALARLLDRWVALFPKARRPAVAAKAS